MPDKLTEKPYSIFPEPLDFKMGMLPERKVKYEKTTQIGDVHTTVKIEGNVNDVIEILKAEDKLLSDTEESESVRLTDMIIDRNEKG